MAAPRPPPLLITPAPGTRILHDVGGVRGLSLLTEAFSLETERRYWAAGPGGAALPAGVTKREGEWLTSEPRAFFCWRVRGAQSGGGLPAVRAAVPA
jgi:hypothetical protein